MPIGQLRGYTEGLVNASKKTAEGRESTTRISLRAVIVYFHGDADFTDVKTL